MGDVTCYPNFGSLAELGLAVAKSYSQPGIQVAAFFGVLNVALS
jgi:hypothetical protein